MYVFAFVKPKISRFLFDVNVLKTQACIQNTGALVVCIAGEAIRVSMLAVQPFLGFRARSGLARAARVVAASPATGAWHGRRPGAWLWSPYGRKPLLWRCLSVLFWPFWAASKAMNRAAWLAAFGAFGVF